MPRFKLTLAYDGTAFVGWQRQAAGASIQGLLEEALAQLEKAPVAVEGAGRTDAGVHALGQVASITLSRDIDAATVRRALNGHLPPAIRVIDVTDAVDQFHARFSSSSKVYRYRLWNAEVVSPFERPFVWHLPAPRLDEAAMDSAARLLVGSHDFASFQGTGAPTQTTVRTLFSSRVIRHQLAPAAAWSTATGEAGALITYEVCGSGFLRHMVRNIVGTLIDVGRGRRTPESMVDVLADRSRTSAGDTAPASGLFLVRVSYEGQDL